MNEEVKIRFSNANNVKIFDLSAGKSLAEWQSEKKKKKMMDNTGYQLIQDFEMPSLSSCVKVSPDRSYVVATGTYKPRVRCYDLSQLSMKFERGLDAEVINFKFLDRDYGKILFLQDERYIELHTQFGRHYRWRIPKFGRDLDFHKPSCNAYFVGASSEIYRFNLETGQFQAPLATDATEVLCCQFNPEHYLFACGTKEGTVECWDPRDRTRAGVLDITKSKFIEDLQPNTLPEVTALKFRDGLTLGVGTSTGHVLLYDIRSGLPTLVKDHRFDLPIKDLDFHAAQDLVLSMDRKIVKMWHRNTGEPFTAIQPDTNLNRLCMVPESGLLFLANEAPKILTYYIPDLGTVPKWCSHLDSLTNDMEESKHQSVYDDFKFLTRPELDELGMTQFIGTNLLVAAMHGFFVNVQLYKEFLAMNMKKGFRLDEYRRDKIAKKLEEKAENQFKISVVKKKLPAVNRNLAVRLMQEQEERAAGEMSRKKKMKRAGNLLEDERFSAIFEDKDFEIDTTSEEYRLLNPVLARLDVKKKKQQQAIMDKFQEVQEDAKSDQEQSDRDDQQDSSSEDDSDSDLEWKSERSKPAVKQPVASRVRKKQPVSKSKMFEMKSGEELKMLKENKKKQLKKTLEERLRDEGDQTRHSSIGNKEYTYRLKRTSFAEEKAQAAQAHKVERRKVRRSAGSITRDIKPRPKFYNNRRVQ